MIPSNVKNEVEMEKYGTPVEVAKYRHTTVDRLAQERYLGKGPAYIKDGRRILYEWAVVDAYLEERTVKTAA